MGGELQNPNDFWGGLTEQDFSIPRVKIGQPTSEGEAGKFNYNNGKSVETLVGCKLLAPKKTRVLYQANSKVSRCGSDDFYVPASRYLKPISNNCMTCVGSEWGEDDPEKLALAKEIGKQGNLKPPLCKETYNLLMLGADNSPFFIQFQGTQLKIVQEKLFSRLKFEYGMHPPYLVQFDMKLNLFSKPGTKYYEIVFDGFGEVQGEQAETISGAWQKFRGIAQDILTKQHEAMDAENADVPF
jgi:hypothetical protein